MREIRLTKAQEMLLSLLKSSLHDKAPDSVKFEAATANEWGECCDLSVKQGVMALAWDGVCKLPKSQQPPQDLKIAWALATEKYEQKYLYYCNVASELSDYYKKHGIETLLLKGVGLSTYYPNPSHREGGDIDIYTYSASPEKMSDEEAHNQADLLMEKLGIEVDCSHSVKHSNFYYKGIPIENHITLLDVVVCELIQQAEAMLRKRMDPESVTLPTGKNILVPSPEFNTLFVAFHTAGHYGHGLALHHLCDWACIIKKYGVQLPSELTDRHFLRGIGALTYLCNRYLGTDVDVKGGEKLAGEIINEIFTPVEHDLPNGSIWYLFRFKVRRFIRVVNIDNTFFHVPLWRNTKFWNKVWNSIIWHVSRIVNMFRK